MFWKRRRVPHPEFKLAVGVHVTDLSGISEGYTVAKTAQPYSVITVNVSADRLEEVFLSLAELVNTPGHVIVEIPTNEEVEKQLRENDQAPFHKDVYYLDGVGFDALKALFVSYAQFFVDDGGVTFGFGSHQGYDEVFVGRYKVMLIYAADPDKYIQKLDKLGYERRDPLRTVWDNLSPIAPGYTEVVTVEGKTVYDLVERLVEQGFYLAERRAS